MTQTDNLPAGLCRSYAPPPGTIDEMFDRDGALRPHWHMFVSLLDDLGPLEIARRWQQAQQLIHDNGVTYNIYGDSRGLDRPWSLDPIPLAVDEKEWQIIENGLAQRATLLNMILADCYGPQRLMADGLLPPELVLGYPNFLRPCHGVKLARWLHLYAADLGRQPGGGYCVISDRTQAPSGAGYALENRIVLSRALPDIFRACSVQRLAAFFRQMREMLASMAPRRKENPNIVLLTPGPYNETYFEHAYLARYLGYTLVEGADLTVRDGRVFLKTLGGLQPVDVILRRLDDDFCDPLELRSDSSLGVAGLVQAVHLGNVAVVNALGSGLVESAALMPMLPTLCRRLLGEELKLPSAPTWWCGEPSALGYVLDNLRRLVVKPVMPSVNVKPVFGETLSADELQMLQQRIRQRPMDFVAQQQLPLSTAPVLTRGAFEPRHVALRVHLTAAGDGYAGMPGGLARFSATPDTLNVSMQHGGGSKDTWVLTSGPVDTFSLLPITGQSVVVSRSGSDLPSRVAENLFWLGRYVERAESLCRQLRGLLLRVASQGSGEVGPETAALFALLVNADANDPLPLLKHTGINVGGVEELLAITADAAHPGSLAAILTNARSLGAVLRDRLSVDAWRIIHGFDRGLPAQVARRSPQMSDVLTALDNLIVMFAALSGLAAESMTRGFAWRFLDMGRRLERAIETLRLLRCTVVPAGAGQALLLELVLEIADSSMTYRRRYLTDLQPAAVLDLLLQDEGNPRAVAFQLVSLSEHIGKLPRGNSNRRRTAQEQIAIRCLSGVRLADVEAVSEVGSGERRARLDEMLAALMDHVQTLSDAIGQAYLSHAGASHQLGALPPMTNL